MSRKVEFKDRDKSLEYLRVGLNMVGIKVDYQTTDLIIKVFELVSKKEGNANIQDTSKIEVIWEEKWNNYFKNIEKDEK